MSDTCNIKNLCSFFANEVNTKQFIKILQKLGVVIFSKDLDSKYVLFSDNIKNFGAPGDFDFAGKGDSDMPWSSIADYISDMDRKVTKNGEIVTYEHGYGEASSRKEFLISKAPIYDDQHCIIGVLGSAIDITKTKKDQEELFIAIEQKERLIDVCGHEMRGPIHSGSLIAKNLIDEWKILSDEEKLERIKIIWAANNKVELIAENLFEVSSLRHGKLKLNIKKCNLKDIVTRDLALFESSGVLIGNKVELIVPDNESFDTYCDPTYISQVFANLLSNAAKFTDNGLITIKLSKVMIDNGKFLQIDVIDTGLGIPEDQMGKIFNFAEQSTKTQGQYVGLGIGLSLCKEIISKHDGRIWASNNHEENGAVKGAIVSFAIPDIDLEPDEVGATKQEDILDRNIKILVIDDDILIHKVLKLVLSRTNFDIVQMVDGSQAIRYLKENCDSVDVILLDYNLRDISGEGIIKILKEDPKTAKLLNRIVIQTGFNVSREDIRHIRKPYTYEDIIALINDVISRNEGSSNQSMSKVI